MGQFRYWSARGRRRRLLIKDRNGYRRGYRPSFDIPLGQLDNILKRTSLEMKYLVIYEKSATGWTAYSPDIPGLKAEGTTLDEVKELIRETMELHLKGTREVGAPAPTPSTATEYIKIDSHA